MLAPDIEEILNEEKKDWNETFFQGETAERLRPYWLDSSTPKHIQRYTTLQSIAYTQLILPDMAIITACIKATYKKKSAIIGYVYSGALRLLNRKTGGFVTREDWTNAAPYIGGDDDLPPTFRHCHVSHGLTYTSQDGEYRGRFVQWNYFHSGYKFHEKLHDVAEDMISTLMNQRKLAFDVFIAYPNAFVDKKDYEESLNESRICIKMFATCWLIENWMNIRHVLPNHINLSYYGLVCHPDLLGHFNKKYENMGGDIALQSFNNDISGAVAKFGQGTKGLFWPRLGQKIIPIHVAERRSPWNIMYTYWKEVYATEKVAELVFNACCVGFPMLHQWYFIENGHAGFFENAGPHDLYEQSKHAKRIEKELRQADQLTRGMHGNYRSVRFKDMSHKILDAVNFGESEICMAPDIGGMILEDVGRTLADWPNVAYETNGYDIMQTLDNYAETARLVFDWLSSLMQMHEQAHFIHSDLHNNNLTVFRMWRYCQTPDKDPNYMFSYVLDDSIYMFPFHGCHGCIIDMSRVIFADSEQLRIIFPEHEIQRMLREQVRAIRLVISSRFSQFYEANKARIEKAMVEHRNAVFDALTAVDVMSLGNNLLNIRAAGRFASGEKTLDPRTVVMGEKLIEFGTNYFMTAFKNIFEGVMPEKSDCARQALHHVMAEFRVEDPAKSLGECKLVDGINCGAPVKRRLRDGLQGWHSADPAFIESVKKKHGKPMTKRWIDYAEVQKIYPIHKPRIGDGINQRPDEIPEWMYA